MFSILINYNSHMPTSIVLHFFKNCLSQLKHFIVILPFSYVICTCFETSEVKKINPIGVKDVKMANNECLSRP